MKKCAKAASQEYQPIFLGLCIVDCLQKYWGAIQSFRLITVYYVLELWSCKNVKCKSFQSALVNLLQELGNFWAKKKTCCHTPINNKDFEDSDYCWFVWPLRLSALFGTLTPSFFKVVPAKQIDLLGLVHWRSAKAVNHEFPHLSTSNYVHTYIVHSSK